MNGENKKILIDDEENVMGFYLSQTLNQRGFSTSKIDEKKIMDNDPLIFILQNSQKEYDVTKITDIFKKHHINPSPLFIVTTDSLIDYIHKLDHLGTIIEIQIDHTFMEILQDDDILNVTEEIRELKYIQTVMNDIVEVILKYVNHPPNEGEYVIENLSHKEKKPLVGVVGLGYVGLPVAVGFAEKYHVIGYDINKKKIESLNNNIDITGEVSKKTLKESSITFTTLKKHLKYCNYIIVIVPTPINSLKKPDLTYLKNASKIVGKNLSPGTIVIYESTVYPGTTEEICIPLLEKYSNLIVGEDFYVGYSPERINPGDKEHTFKKSNKIVSGHDNFTLEKIYKLYDRVLEAEVYKSPSIKVAEAAKIVENIQRDINIALMNELAIIFDHLDIDTSEVLKAAQTKWNFIPFKPGLVGGHCIGIDPYYLIYKSTLHGYEPELVVTARDINDQMPNYVVRNLLELIIKHQFNGKDLKVTVLGITFKENVSDIRNSKSLEIVNKLQSLGISVQVCDPMLSLQTFNNKEIDLREFSQLDKAHAVILAVPSNKFSYKNKNFFNQLLYNNQGIVMDIKGVIPNNVLHKDIIHWKL